MPEHCSADVCFFFYIFLFFNRLLLFFFLLFYSSYSKRFSAHMQNILLSNIIQYLKRILLFISFSLTCEPLLLNKPSFLHTKFFCSFLNNLIHLNIRKLSTYTNTMKFFTNNSTILKHEEKQKRILTISTLLYFIKRFLLFYIYICIFILIF